MKRELGILKFTKMQGIGNDYIYVNGFEERVENPSELTVKLSNRRFGIGGDGMIFILPSDSCDFRMQMFNADGSESGMCGNGARCVGKYVYDNGMTTKTSLTLETGSGVKHLELHVDGGKVTEVTVNMGKAVLTPADIPMLADGNDFINRQININGNSFSATCVSMGNPHCVVFTPDTDEIPLESIGPLFEHYKLFPQRTNAEFIKVIDRNHLKMRVWERGTGETLACGTGACASVVAAVLNKHCPYDENITVQLRGGSLKIMYKSDGTVLMTGSAETVFTGEIEL